MTASPFAPQHLRGIIEREERAERDLRGARAQALVDLIDKRSSAYSDEDGPLTTAYALARAEVSAKTVRASTKLAEARVERRMAEYVAQGYVAVEAG